MLPSGVSLLGMRIGRVWHHGRRTVRGHPRSPHFSMAIISVTLDIGVFCYIGIVQHKELSPEVLSIPPGTPCIYCVYRKYIHYSPICPVEIQTFPVGWNCQSHNPRNLTALNEYYLFDIGVIFQEHNRGLN